MWKKLTSVAALAAVLSTPAIADEVTVMHVATAGPPTHVQNSVVFPTWAKWIEEATEGRVEVKIEYGFGNQGTFFNLVEDGVADAAWAYHGYVPGRFQLTSVVELPNLGTNAEGASGVYWDAYQTYLADAGEHDGLELLALFTYGPGQIHSTMPVNSLDDLKGKKIRVGGGVQKELADLMDVTSVSAPGPKVYEMLQQGIVDGVFMPAASQKDFRLAEVAPNLTLFPGGLYLGSFAIFTNEEFLDGLRPEDRQAILDVSGKQLSQMAGQAWDQSDEAGIEAAKAQGVTIRELSEDDPMVAAFRELTADLEAEWLKAASELDADAEQALASLREEVKSAQATSPKLAEAK